MTQDEIERMVQELGQCAIRQQHLNEQQAQLNERLVTAIERLDTAIERLDITLQAIKDMLERGNGH
jgi:flagellar capping protein FliD